jgi:general secretion pathway protein D
MVQALQSSSDVNIISTPHILASDNEESEITVGQTVPFQQGVPSTTSLAGLSGTGTQNLATALSGISTYIPVQRQPVELRLRLKPQISEGDNIRLNIDEQIEEITSTDAVLGPTTSKRTIKTQIVARDQSTIVIGGLIQERGVRSVKKVPFLGSLPILGWLFRDTQTTTTKTNLLLFLTPYIIRDEADYRRIYEKKRKEQQYFIEQFYGRRPGYEVAIDFTRKSGPYAHMRRDVLEEAARPENGGPGVPGERVISAPGTPPDAALHSPGAPPAPVPAAPPAMPGLPPEEAAEPPAGIPPEEAQPVPPVPEP